MKKCVPGVTKRLTTIKKIFMKNFLSIFVFGLLVSCNTAELTRQEAFELIRQQKPYPKVVDYDIYCGDPSFAKLALKAGLDKKGLVTMQQTQKLKDIGKPLITFKEKAKPYLLPTPEKDRDILVQKVKLADEEIGEVVTIQITNDNTQAIVEYTTKYKNVNDFAGMTPFNFSKTNHKKAFLFKDDKKWKLKK